MFGMRSAIIAFTLIELLAVILLIGILSAIAFPRNFNLFEDADKAAILATYNSFRAGIENVIFLQTIHQKNEIDLDRDGKTNVFFTDIHGATTTKNIYPTGIFLNDTKYTLSTNSYGLGSDGETFCLELFRLVMSSTYKISNEPCFENGNQFCALSDADNKSIHCSYFYQGRNDKFGRIDYYVESSGIYLSASYGNAASVEPDILLLQANTLDTVLATTGDKNQLWIAQQGLSAEDLDYLSRIIEQSTDILGIKQSLTPTEKAKALNYMNANSRSLNDIWRDFKEQGGCESEQAAETYEFIKTYLTDDTHPEPLDPYDCP